MGCILIFFILGKCGKLKRKHHKVLLLSYRIHQMCFASGSKWIRSWRRHQSQRRSPQPQSPRNRLFLRHHAAGSYQILHTIIFEYYCDVMRYTFQIVSYHAQGQSRSKTSDIFRISGGKIGSGSSALYHDIIHIPPLPPSRLENCRLIHVQYAITVSRTVLLFIVHIIKKINVSDPLINKT